MRCSLPRTWRSSDLLGLTLLIAVGFLLAVAFYQTLSTRDVLVRHTRLLAARLSARWWVRGLIYVAVVMVGIPILVLIWAMVVDVALFVLSPPESIGTIAIVAVSVVGATRVLAYANERVSHELAKALPLALLFLLLTGGNPHLEAKFEALRQLDTAEMTDVMIAFLIVLEISLRIVTDGSARAPGLGAATAGHPIGPRVVAHGGLVAWTAAPRRPGRPSAWRAASSGATRRQLTGRTTGCAHSDVRPLDPDPPAVPFIDRHAAAASSGTLRWQPHAVGTEHGVQMSLTLLDWRRRVAAMYTDGAGRLGSRPGGDTGALPCRKRRAVRDTPRFPGPGRRAVRIRGPGVLAS